MISGGHTSGWTTPARCSRPETSARAPRGFAAVALARRNPAFAADQANSAPFAQENPLVDLLARAARPRRDSLRGVLRRLAAGKLLIDPPVDLRIPHRSTCA